MRYRTLGRSGLKISEVCLGGMNFGSAGVGTCDEPEAVRIVHSFLEAGGNIIDTADAYSGGQSEEIIGRAVKGKRGSVVLATKAFLPHGPGPNERGLSRAHLITALDASLRRLGTDYVDLYQCHQWDDSTPIEETMQTMDDFVRAGKVRYIGCSNFTAAQTVEAQWAAERLNATSFISLQPQYSMVARGIEAEILPTCERHGLGTLIWSPLGGGVLTGRFLRGAAPDADSRLGRLMDSPSPMAREWAGSLFNERSLEVADQVIKVAAELGVTPTSVALSWIRRRPGVTAVIIGPRSLDQLDGNLAGFVLDMPPEASKRLDRISAASVLPPVNGMGTRA